jgi:hypothetical protein
VLADRTALTDIQGALEGQRQRFGRAVERRARRPDYLISTVRADVPEPPIGRGQTLPENKEQHTMITAKRCTAALAGVLGAFALSVPVAGATTTPTPFAGFHFPTFTPPTLPTLPAFTGLPAFAGLPAFTGVTPAAGVPISFIGPSVGFVGVAIGPTVIGSVFNGATVVQVVNGPAGSSVIGSP